MNELEQHGRDFTEMECVVRLFVERFKNSFFQPHRQSEVDKSTWQRKG